MRQAILAFALAAGCYSPDLRDCTVRCEAVADCAQGQVCGAAHLCAAPDVASQCERTLTTDARTAPSVDGAVALADSRTVADSRAAIDSPSAVDAALPLVILHLHDDGKGDITTSSGAACLSQGAQHGDCMIEVPQGVAVTLSAMGEMNNVFKQWSGQACTGSDATCVVTPTMPMTDIHAQFVKEDDGAPPPP